MARAQAKKRRSSFGSIRTLPSGRLQVRYTGPDEMQYPGPFTFDTQTDAEEYLSGVRTDIVRGHWKPPSTVAPAVTEIPKISAYIAGWIETRLTKNAQPLKPKTKSHYRWLLRTLIDPVLGDLDVTVLSPAAVRAWYTGLDTGRTAKAHAYSLLQSAMQTAVDDDKLLEVNPCRIKGAGKVKRAKDIRPASLDELEVIVKSVPDRMQLIILLSSWCALRFGEVTELRRKDIDLANGVVRIHRGVTRVDGEIVVGTPKSDAGKRPVHFPPHLAPAIKDHLKRHTQLGPEGLLFWGPKTGQQLPHSSLLYRWNKAKHLANRDDMSPHALRHTGAVLAAQNGATLKELMARLGHSTPDAALQYQHAAEDRDKLIAERLSETANRKASS